jgi:glycosyltransferase involved in cell wall biosynthesis
MANRPVHLLATPNVQSTADYYLDVFNGITRRFATLLHDLDIPVYLYGSEEADCPVDELITCVTKKEQADWLGDVPYQHAWYDKANPMFAAFNARANAAIQKRKAPGDWICTIAGSANLPIWQQHSDCRFLEYSIGYKGVCAPYRIYQSQAWRHVLHGVCGMDYGRTTDDVIYHWMPEDDFPEGQPEDYVLYVGRINDVKGIKGVCDSAQAAGVRLVLIGEGDISLITYGEYVGTWPAAERNRWMAGAKALLCPTQYIEPSATVVVEAQLCGTPVISTPWGGFPEYIEDRRTGFLCKSPREFVQAIDRVSELDRDYTRARARMLYGWDAGKRAYQQYFERQEQLLYVPLAQRPLVEEQTWP